MENKMSRNEQSLFENYFLVILCFLNAGFVALIRSCNWYSIIHVNCKILNKLNIKRTKKLKPLNSFHKSFSEHFVPELKAQFIEVIKINNIYHGVSKFLNTYHLYAAISY